MQTETSNYEWPGFILMILFGFIVVSGPYGAFVRGRIRNMIIFAFVVRVAGVLLRHWVIYGFYEGGDATGYYKWGLYYADYIRHFDLSFFDQVVWHYGRLWGTAAVTMISALVLSLIGPTQRGEFLIFALLSLLGLLLFCKAFIAHFPQSDTRKYARLVLLWPSIWFWTCSAGKDALILLAIGCVVYGYAGNRNKINWIFLLLGVLLAGIIRPHVAGILVVSVAVAHWISAGINSPIFHKVQGVAILILAVLVVKYGFANLGVTDFDIENIREYVEFVSARSTQGDSPVYAPGLTLVGVPMAFINIFFRPLPWEVSHPLMAAASLELMVMWYLIFRRRRRMAQVLKQWRSNRLLKLALPFVLLYILMLGMAVGNLGIIARQRIHILPLVFVLLEASPRVRQIKKGSPEALQLAWGGTVRHLRAR